MRKFVKDNSLSIVFLALFLGALVLQAFAGHADFNEDQDRHGDARVSLGRYVLSSEFGTAVLENWQSEYLQFTLFILLTVWLLQRGLARVEKTPQGGARVRLRAESRPPCGRGFAAVGEGRRPAAHALRELLLLVMAAIWLASWFGQSVTGVSEYNTERLDHHQLPVSWLDYLSRPDFWEKTLQNWQSEFLAVGLNGDPRGLPASARLARVEAGRGAARQHRHRGLARFRPAPPGTGPTCATGSSWPRSSSPPASWSSRPPKQSGPDSTA